MSTAVRRSAREFAELVTEFGDRLSADPDFAELVTALCGSAERVQAFTRPSGVGISVFAALLGLPASTIRHYERLGLVTPYEVNGRFRFWFHNLIEVESVRQWRDLGLSLDDIQAQRRQDYPGSPRATVNVLAAGSIGVMVTGKAVLVMLNDPARPLPLNALRPQALWVQVDVEQRQPFGRAVWPGPPDRAGPVDVARLRQEIRVARQRLEEQRRRLDQQLSRADLLDAALARASRLP